MCFVYILSQALQYLYKHTLVDREIHIIYQIVYIFKYIHLDAIDRYQRLQHIFNMISLICLNTYLHVIFENYIRLLAFSVPHGLGWLWEPTAAACGLWVPVGYGLTFYGFYTYIYEILPNVLLFSSKSSRIVLFCSGTQKTSILLRFHVNFRENF